ERHRRAGRGGAVRQHPRLPHGDAAGARLRGGARHSLLEAWIRRRQLHGGGGGVRAGRLAVPRPVRSPRRPRRRYAGARAGRQGGWRAPVFAVATLGTLVTVCALLLLPPLRGHLAGGQSELPRYAKLLRNPLVRVSYLMTAVTMMAGFVLIPNISAYVQYNL